MPYPVFLKKDMEDEVQVSVVDVYDLAHDIGQEFEKIIDSCGTATVTSLMPLVISALEHLEKLACRHENANGNIQELKATITHLENEKLDKAEDRIRYEKELEEIEDRFREESHELVAMVTRLQDENRKLSTSLASRKENGMVPHANGVTSTEADMKVVSKLQEVIEGQRTTLKKQERELHDKNKANECLSQKLDCATVLHRELRRRQRISSGQIRVLIDERAELQAALQEERRGVALLQQRLGLAEKENQDLSISSNDSLDLNNKLVFDKDDPNRPRFTMTELKEILYERNDLKARVSDLEDELSVFKPIKSQSQRPRSHIICPPLDIGTDDTGASATSGQEDSLSAQLQEATPPLCEPPVQGPIPCDPADAPWRKRKEESGIRKFFKNVGRVAAEVILGDVEEGIPCTGQQTAITKSNTTTTTTAMKSKTKLIPPFKKHPDL